MKNGLPGCEVACKSNICKRQKTADMIENMTATMIAGELLSPTMREFSLGLYHSCRRAQQITDELSVIYDTPPLPPPIQEVA